LGLRLGKGRPLLHQCGLSLGKGVTHLLQLTVTSASSFT
jgi:hypothetical protein